VAVTVSGHTLAPLGPRPLPCRCRWAPPPARLLLLSAIKTGPWVTDSSSLPPP
jgi:hypothetical protein